MEYTIHIVKEHDSFYRLEHRYNVTAQTIIDTHNQLAGSNNQLTLATTIHPGEKIYIPISKRTAEGTYYVIYQLEGTFSLEAPQNVANYYGITLAELRHHNPTLPPRINDNPVTIPVRVYSTSIQQTNTTQAENETVAENTSETGNSTAAEEAQPASCDSILNGAGNPNCKASLDIAVQVTGLQHTAATQHQKLKIQHATSEGLCSKSIAPECHDEINQKTIAPSTIFKWGDDATAPSNQTAGLILEIATEKGAPIQLPILTKYSPNGSTPNFHEYYLINRLRAIEPFSYILTDMDGTKFFAPARSGYLYLFMNGKLWRELFIGRDEATGANRYQDVNLANYRQVNATGEYTYKKGPREITGKPLQDIWIPEAFHLNQPINIKVAYSDAPWSSERINYLETNKTILSLRATDINWNTGSEDLFTDEKRVPYHDGALRPIKVLSESRGRDETTEFLLDCPHLFLKKSDHLEKALNNATHFKQTLAKKTQSANANFAGEETSAWHYQLLKQKKERSNDEEDTYKQLASLWEHQPPFHDVWQTSKNRGIYGLQVADVNYHLKYNKHRILQQIQLQQQLAKDAEQQEYYELASFIEKQRLLVKQFQEGLDDDISTEGRRLYQEAINKNPRDFVNTRLKKHQQIISDILQWKAAPEVFADMMSNEDNGTDLIGHYNHLAELLLYSTLPQSNYDSLAPINTDIKETDFKRRAVEYVYTIFTDKKNPYHKMLWPDITSDALNKPYVAASPQANKGDGIFNPSTWEKMVRENVLETKDPVTLNGVMALKLLDQAKHLPLLDKSNYPNFKSTASAIFTIIGELKKATDYARKLALQSSSDVRKAQANLVEALEELNNKKHTLQQAEASESATQKQLQNYQNKVSQAEASLKKIEQAAEAKLTSAGIIKSRMPVKDIQLLRIVSGGKLNNLQFKLVTSVPINGQIGEFVVVGMPPSPKSGTSNIKRKFELFDNDVQLSNSGTKGVRADIELLVLPKNDPYLQLRQQQLAVDIPDLEAHIASNNAAVQLTEGKLLSLQQARAAAESNVNVATQTHGQALADRLNVGTLFRKRMGKAIFLRRIQSVTERINKTGTVPSILLGLELLNLKFFNDSFENLERTRETWRARWGMSVVYGNTVMATLVVLEQIEAKMYSLAKKPIARVSLGRLLNFDSKLLMALKLPNVAAKLVPIGGLAIVGIGLSISDTWDAFQHGDSAVWGNAVLVLAGITGLIGIYATTSSPILGLGPIGWAAWTIGLIAVGVGLLIFGSDSDLEQWFKQGPFGGYNSYPSLKDKKAALAALLNLITQPQVTLEKNTLQLEAQQKLATTAADSENYQFLQNISKANLCITIHSGLLNFSNQDVAINYEANLYLCEQKDTLSLGSETWTSTYTYTKQTSHKVLHVEKTPQGTILFVYTPPNIPVRSESSWGSQFRNQKNYYWIVASQVQSTLDEAEKSEEKADKTKNLMATFYFPAPSFKDKKTYNSTVDNTPTFKVPSTTYGTNFGGTLTAEELTQDYWHKVVASTKVFNA